MTKRIRVEFHDYDTRITAEGQILYPDCGVTEFYPPWAPAVVAHRNRERAAKAFTVVQDYTARFREGLLQLAGEVSSGEIAGQLAKSFEGKAWFELMTIPVYGWMAEESPKRPARYRGEFVAWLIVEEDASDE